MFLGHFAAALAAKRSAPRVSLGWLVAAGQLPDLIWPVLVLAGIERVRIAPGDTAYTPLAFEYYPWSHSLVMVAVWGVVFGTLYFAVRRNGRGAVVLGAVVVSHWVLDWITHRPDLPLVPGLTTVTGLGLWDSVPATIALELALIAAGAALYLRLTMPRDRRGTWVFAAWIAFLIVTQFASGFGPPPPSVTAVAASALSMWLLVIWAWWADFHRAPATDASSG
ncbi:MAG TPA: hypothetical protein VK922_10775 [Gemmatimonadaceae bacterium]|nr:hypothetical protein [Gemmatimonadaceae bacterium]